MSALSISLVPGALPEDGDQITNATLRAIARPTVTLNGSIGTATIDDDSITTAKLRDGVLSADATGRAKMADGFVTTEKIEDLAVTAAKLAATLDLTGKTVTLPDGTLLPAGGLQTVAASSGAVATLTGAVVYDDNIPQNTAGSAISALDCTITPRSATSTLEITVCLNLNNEDSSATMIAALFQDSVADALAAAVSNHSDNGEMTTVCFTHRMTSGTTSATTFKVRAGATSGNVTLNGVAGLRKLGGVLKSWIIVKEL